MISDGTPIRYTQHRLAAKEVQNFVNLQQFELNGTFVKWHDTRQIQPFPADLILVDGSPTTSGLLARHLAPQCITAFIKPGTWLLLDNYYRTQETETVARWLKEQLDLELVQVLPYEKGLAVMRFKK